MKFSQMFRKALIGASFVGMATSLGGQSAEAATETADLDVSVEVLTSCQVTTAPVNFGTYDPLGVHATANLDNSAGEVRITCANGLPVVVRLGEGANPGTGSTAALPVRQMLGAVDGDVIGYNLFTNAPGGTVWGDTTATGVGTTGTGALQVLTIHGRIPFGQNPAADDYTDTVVASVDF